MPAAICTYWITNNFMTFSLNYIMNSKPVKSYFGIKDSSELKMLDHDKSVKLAEGMISKPTIH